MAVAAAINDLSGGLGEKLGIKADNILGNALLAAGTSYVTSASTGFVNSVNWSDLGGERGCRGGVQRGGEIR
jgi:hypothetical protein